MRRTTQVSVATSALLLLAVACSDGEFREASYTSYRDLSSSEDFKRRWIPEWIPVDATRIRHAHDLDTNEVFLSFAVAQRGQLQIGECTRSERPTVELPSRRSRALAWWPTFLRDGAGQLERTVEIYLCDGKGRKGFLAKREFEVWYWELGA